MPRSHRGGAGRGTRSAAESGALGPPRDRDAVDRIARVLPPEAVASSAERRRWAELVHLLVSAEPPPDPEGASAGFLERQDRLRTAVDAGRGEEVEEAFLDLYAHLHGHESPYVRAERRIVDDSGGYWGHAGGLSPVLKAPDWLRPESVAVDFGAGNGLQGLLMQYLAPHRLTVQVEISSNAVETGRRLCAWLGIEPDRIDWRVEDVREAVRDDDRYEFVYLYRPVRPDGPGRGFYEDLAAKLAAARHPITIFSIADALGPFLPDQFEVVYGDGHLTCFHRPGTG